MDSTAACHVVNYANHPFLIQGASVIITNAIYREKQLVLITHTKVFRSETLNVSGRIRHSEETLIHQPRYDFEEVEDILNGAADRVVSAQRTVISIGNCLYILCNVVMKD